MRWRLAKAKRGDLTFRRVRGRAEWSAVTW